MLTKTLDIPAILVIAFLTSFSSTAQAPDPTKYPTEVDRPISPTKINQVAVRETQEQSTLSSLPESILNAELKSARGGSFELSSYLGNVVVLNFWATWCVPCRYETPVLARLQKEYQARGVRMIGLSTEDRSVSARDVRDWIRAFRVNYRIGWATEEFASILMQGRGALPQIL